MKRYIILFPFLLFTTIFFAQQHEYTKVRITGFGAFLFGMNKEKVREAISFHETSNTAVSDLGISMQISNMELAGLVFDKCACLFYEKKLITILLSKSFHDSNIDIAFTEFLSILENDYGKQKNRDSELYSGKDSISFMWTDKKSAWVSF